MPKEFTLEAFGIPEPGSRRPRFRWGTLAAVNLAVAALALWLFFRWQRRA